MSYKKLMYVGIGIFGLLAIAPSRSVAQTVYDPGDINSILEDNSLRDTISRYMSVYSFFFPEEASRLGFTSNHNSLNDRSLETDAQALQALESVRSALNEISPARLSPAKVVEYNLLKNELNNIIWLLGQNRLSRDPLYYTQALDAVYDLLLFNQQDKRQAYLDLVGRVSALSKIAKQARQNLTDTSPQTARLAMEKAYYAYVSFEEINKRLMEGENLRTDSNAESPDRIARNAKAAIKSMFELFKSLSQQEDMPMDFRMGSKPYETWLKLHYQITDRPDLLEKKLSRQFEAAQKNLWEALRPFDLAADLEEVTVVEDLNEPPQDALLKPTEKKLSKQKKDNSSKSVYTPPSAGQFYALAQQLQSPFSANTLLDDFSKQTSSFATRLVRSKVIPTNMSFNMAQLPAYFAYQNLYLKIPALRMLFLRVPSGNRLAREQALKQDYNEPSNKLLISQELVPGHYYQEYNASTSLRRTLGSATLANGWKEYALQIAEKQNYFATDEERLFLAWHRYERALLALLDQRVHTQRYTYDMAVQFLTEEQGFTEEEATRLLSQVIAEPGASVSYVIGEQLWKQSADYYQKKLQDERRVNTLLLQAGNVLPTDLKAELKRLYRK